MTVTEKSSRKVISGSGWANPLTHDYMIENASYAHVFADEVELVQGVDYIVSDVGVMAGYVITIVDDDAWTPDEWVLDARPPIAQGKDLTVGGVFGAKFEDGLDQLTRRLQRVYDVAMRGLKFPLETPPGDEPYELPLPIADTFIGWNGAGTELESKTVVGLGLVVLSDDGTLVDASHTEAVTEFAAKTYADTKLALETKTSLAAKTVPSSVGSILLIGDATAGDDGDPVLLVRDPSATVGYLPDAAPSKWANLSHTIKLSKAFHGADPLGVAASQNAIITAVAELMAKGGGKLIIPNGDYLCAASAIPAVLTGDLEIEFAPDAWLIADTGLAVPVLNLRASVAAATTRQVRIYNPQINCSAGDSSGSGNLCTAINTQYFQQALIEGGYLYGGEIPNNTNSDSGWTPTADTYARMEGTRIRGFGDLGVYATGDNTVGAVGDGFEVMLRDVTIERCFGAVSSKREMNLLTVDGCTINECTAGTICTEVAVPYVGPGRRLDVFNTTFRKITSNVMRWRGPAKGSAIGNTIEDFGYDYDGTGSVGANAFAIYINGASGIQIKDNDIRLNAWARDDQRAIRSDNLTLDGVPYTHGGNHFEGNTYRGLNRYIVVEAAGNPSLFINEVMEDIPIKFSGLNANSVVTYRVVGETASRARIGSVDFVNNLRAVINAPAGATLTAADSGKYYTNAGATARSDFLLPLDPTPGVTYEFSCMDTDGLRVIAATGDQIRVAGVASAAGGRIDNADIGTYIKLTAVDSTNWIAEGALGTWTVT